MNEHVQRLIVRGSDMKAGVRFGRLRVLGKPFWSENERGWREANTVCECTCGGVCVAECRELQDGRAQSCGCLRGALSRAGR